MSQHARRPSRPGAIVAAIGLLAASCAGSPSTTDVVPTDSTADAVIPVGDVVATDATARDVATGTDAATRDAPAIDAASTDARADVVAPTDAARADVVAPTDAGGRRLLWSDEFNAADGTGPDPAHWSNETGGNGWGNQEREFYTAGSANAVQMGGSLVITARRESPAGSTCWYGACQYSSARLVTRGHFAQRYGRFEARIQIPRGQGIWPAFWMLGDDIGTAGWPACGELDIMENIGREPTRVHGTIHGPGYSGAAGIGAPYDLPDGAVVADGFHVFAVEWDPAQIRWLVDEHVYETRTTADLPGGTRWVFDHPFFLLLNLAVGGGWPGDPDGTTTFPQTMRVDYVRVYSQ